MSKEEVSKKINAMLAELSFQEGLDILREVAEHKRIQVKRSLDNIRETETELVEIHDGFASFAKPEPLNYSVIE